MDFKTSDILVPSITDLFLSNDTHKPSLSISDKENDSEIFHSLEDFSDGDLKNTSSISNLKDSSDNESNELKTSSKIRKESTASTTLTKDNDYIESSSSLCEVLSPINNGEKNLAQKGSFLFGKNKSESSNEWKKLMNENKIYNYFYGTEKYMKELSPENNFYQKSKNYISKKNVLLSTKEENQREEMNFKNKGKEGQLFNSYNKYSNWSGYGKYDFSFYYPCYNDNQFLNFNYQYGDINKSNNEQSEKVNTENATIKEEKEEITNKETKKEKKEGTNEEKKPIGNDFDLMKKQRIPLSINKRTNYDYNIDYYNYYYNFNNNFPNGNFYYGGKYKKRINCKPFTEREGDWVCSGCGNLNFAFRKECNRCGLQKSQEKNNEKENEIIYKETDKNKDKKESQIQTNKEKKEKDNKIPNSKKNNKVNNRNQNNRKKKEGKNKNKNVY